jgi:hypothetical protein
LGEQGVDATRFKDKETHLDQHAMPSAHSLEALQVKVRQHLVGEDHRPDIDRKPQLEVRSLERCILAGLRLVLRILLGEPLFLGDDRLSA